MAADLLALPLDILALIAMKLDTLEDFIYFFAVCRWFRNRVRPLIENEWKTIPEPWLLLAENTKDNPDCLRKVFNLHNNKCYQFNLPETFGTKCWGSAYGWIAMVDRDLNIQLFNPVTKAQICFPSLKTIPDIPNPELYVQYDGEDYIHWFLRCYLTKVVVLKVSQNGHHEFVIVVLYKSNLCLVYARHGDPSWTPVYIPETGAPIVDVVGGEGDVVALYNNAAIGNWNLNDKSGSGLVNPVTYYPGKRGVFEDFDVNRVGKMYLVQSGADLLMLLRYKEEVFNNDRRPDFDIAYRTTRFKVFRLNPTNKEWEKIDDLGDMALFVGENSSMSISVARAKCMQRNCIYFTDDENEWWAMPIEFGGHDMGVFDINCGQIWRFYDGADTRSLSCPPALFVPVL